MSSSIAAVAESVRTKLALFGGIPDPPVRTYRPMAVFKDLAVGAYAIQVVAGTNEFERITRDPQHGRIYRIDVAVSRKTDGGNTQADEAVLMGEYLMQYMMGAALNISSVRYTGIEQEAAFVPEHFKDYGVLTTVFTLVYETVDG